MDADHVSSLSAGLNRSGITGPCNTCASPLLGWKSGRRGCSRQRYAAAPTSVTHVLRPGRGILVRPPRLRPKSSRLDCSRSRFDDGLCERVLPLDARKQPPVSEPRLPMLRCVGVGLRRSMAQHRPTKRRERTPSSCPIHVIIGNQRYPHRRHAWRATPRRDRARQARSR